MNLEALRQALAVQGRIEAGIREAETWANEGER